MLKFDSSEHINKFINDLSSYCLHPQILLIQISGNSKTIIDNMFSNIANHLLKMLLQYDFYYMWSPSAVFLFAWFFFLIIIPTREMLKYMTGADLMRTHF